MNSTGGMTLTMNKLFVPLNTEQLKDNTFNLIGQDWMLITSGNMPDYNTMTASWGGLGVLWGKNVCFCFIRPSRYTYEYMERNDSFTLSFFEESYRRALSFCGSNSGRDVNKAAGAGITPMKCADDMVSFEEARLIIKCRKLYFHDLDPGHFLSPEIEKSYNQKDYHRLYIGEIIECLQQSTVDR